MNTSWNLEHWDALIRGDDCPICNQNLFAKTEDAHNLYITDLSLSRLYLAKNQFVIGYCVLMCRRHVIEPWELTPEERSLFFDDLAHAGRALQSAFNADKMNYNILGNIIPHLHAHILPRYFTDSAPNRPIDPGLKGHEVYLDTADYAKRIETIRASLR